MPGSPDRLRHGPGSLWLRSRACRTVASLPALSFQLPMGAAASPVSSPGPADPSPAVLLALPRTDLGGDWDSGRPRRADAVHRPRMSWGPARRGSWLCSEILGCAIAALWKPCHRTFCCLETQPCRDYLLNSPRAASPAPCDFVYTQITGNLHFVVCEEFFLSTW